MIIFNRVLIIFNFLFAIAVCVGAFLLNQRRIELRERSDKMAASIDATVKSVEKTPGGVDWFGTDNQTTLTEVNLGWKKYHLDAAGKYENWDKDLATLEKLGTDVSTYRDEVAKRIVDLGNVMKAPIAAQEDTAQNLNGIQTWKAPVQNLEDHFASMRKREDVVIDSFFAVSEAIQKPVDAELIKSIPNLQGEKYLPSLKQLEVKAKSLYDRATFYADYYKKLSDPIDKELFQFQADADAMASEDNYEEAIKTLVATDMPELNKKLIKLKETLELAEKQRVRIAELEETKDQLEAEVSNLKNQVGAQEVTIKRLQDRLAWYIKNEGAKLRPDFTAKVIEYDAEYEFVVLDKGLDQEVVPGASIIISTGDKFVCKAKITRVLKDKCIAEILPDTFQAAPAVGNEAIAR